MQAVAPFIDPVTKKKIYFIEPGAGGAATMASLFDMSGLEECMGGGVPGTVYDHGAYGRRMEGEEVRMRAQIEALRAAEGSEASGSPSGPSLSRLSSGGSVGGLLKSVGGRGSAAVHAHGEAAWVTRISSGGAGGGLLASREGSEVWYDAEEGWAAGDDGAGEAGDDDGSDGGWTVARP
jgi:hypothetical protein